MATETASVARLNTSAMILTSLSRARRSASAPGADRPGSSEITTAPASGIAPVTVSQGKLLMGSAASPALEPDQEERADEQRRSHEHGQRVRTDKPCLHPAEPSGTAAEGGGHGVDQAVHAPVVEEYRQPGQPQARPHQQRLVDRVAVQVLASGHGNRAARGRGFRD